jgi:hypothetical protein
MLKNVQEELNRFAKYVIQQSRTNLTKSKKNSSKELYNSLKSDLNVSANSFSLSFLMEDYGVFQDKGVKGTRSNYIENKNTPYSYKQSSNLVGVEYHTGTFAKWAKSNNIRLRDEKGRFKKGNYKSIGFVIARSVKEKGVKASFFFTKPFEKAFKNLDKDIIKAYELDVEELLKFTTNGNN